MQTVQPSLFTRDDTFFGVCEALGQDFRFNPLWLRLALTASLFFNPAATVGGYVAVGAAILLSRKLYPESRLAADVQVEAEPERVEVEAGEELVALAA